VHALLGIDTKGSPKNIAYATNKATQRDARFLPVKRSTLFSSHISLSYHAVAVWI